LFRLEPAEEESGFAISQVEQYGEASVYLFGEENRIDTNPNGNMDFEEVIDDELTYSISSTSTTTSMSTIKPVFVTKLPAKLYVKENDNIYLKCSYKGSPHPTIQWKKNGNLIGNNKWVIITKENNNLIPKTHDYYRLRAELCKCFLDPDSGKTWGFKLKNGHFFI
jgi:hypothetical protein